MDDFLKVALVLISVFAGLLAFRFLAVFIALLRSPCWPLQVSPLIWQPGLAPDEQGGRTTLADRVECDLQGGHLCRPPNENGATRASVHLMVKRLTGV